MHKNGTRLQSQVCNTQVIVVKTGEQLDDLRCGGVAMTPIGAPRSEAAAIDPKLADGTVMGKRYVDALGAEVLVTKAGDGTLTIGANPMNVKDAKPLPASD